MITFGSLFAGIGGFDLGLERAGMQCKWQVEIDPYCQRVLAKHWPDVARYGDIRDCGKHNLEPVDLICGGFPCQPFSVAGKQAGKADDRYLWPEMLRIIAEVRPAWVLGENVAGIIPMELDTVLDDLEGQGYETQTFVLPACSVDAPHRRDRVWIVAYAESRTWWAGIRQAGPEQYGNPSGNSCKCVSNTNFEQARRITESREKYCQWLPEPNVGRVAHGVPHRVDRLRSLGNAVSPPLVQALGEAIALSNAWSL